jgi:class 3 adenylate cyclase
MSAQTKKLAILFADISGSTALYEKLGDQRARVLIARCLFMLKSALNTHNGSLIKTIGDEILCTFPSAEAAFNAACEMQMSLHTDNQHTEHSMHIRIGFHYGDVICEDGDIYGDSVNVASRVASITRASQIMTTSAVVDALPLSLHNKVRKILRADIKGKQEQLDIHQVMWELEDMGSTRIGMPAFRKPVVEVAELTLSYRSQPRTVNMENKKLLLGRDNTCQMIIKNDFVSRQHANVELRSGNFVLTDHSSNGTYVRTSNGEVSRINRSELTLRGKGTISLGQHYSEDPVDLVEYEVVQQG